MPSRPPVSPGHGSIPATAPVATALYVLTGSIVLGYTIGIAIVGPSMYSDQGMGFLVLEAMKRGGPFNEVPVPDPADISQDMGFFVA